MNDSIKGFYHNLMYMMKEFMSLLFNFVKSVQLISLYIITGTLTTALVAVYLYITDVIMSCSYTSSLYLCVTFFFKFSVNSVNVCSDAEIMVLESIFVILVYIQFLYNILNRMCQIVLLRYPPLFGTLYMYEGRFYISMYDYMFSQ